jgi:hypothetical protein
MMWCFGHLLYPGHLQWVSIAGTPRGALRHRVCTSIYFRNKFSHTHTSLTGTKSHGTAMVKHNRLPNSFSSWMTGSRCLLMFFKLESVTIDTCQKPVSNGPLKNQPTRPWWVKRSESITFQNLPACAIHLSKHQIIHRVLGELTYGLKDCQEGCAL